MSVGKKEKKKKKKSATLPIKEWRGKFVGQVVGDVSLARASEEERSGRDTLSPRKRKRLQSAARFKKNV